MKAATLKDLKSALNHLGTNELHQIIQRLARLRQENKELLSYLLFEVKNESQYIAGIKSFIDEEFEIVNPLHPYLAKKTIRKILKRIKRLSKFSESNQTEVEVLLYFIEKGKTLKPHILNSTAVKNIFAAQQLLITKAIANMHPDLQYDYKKRINDIQLNP